MNTIRILPESVVKKIAAGEVIERPGFAVKELIENAIDAKATHITIRITDAGLSKIHITDNGIGMSREDALVCFKPHATSKLTHEDDLLHLSSLGFRGEALASIASVSTLTIHTRTKKEALGTQVIINQGKLVSCDPVGSPQGTTITVDQLFSFVPARKKFLSHKAQEWHFLLSLVTHYTLSFPHISFQLFHQNKLVVSAPANQTPLERVRLVLGETIAQNAISFSTEDGTSTLSGFLMHPKLATATPSKQYLFINNRPLSNKFITQAIKEGYGTLLPKSSYPIVIISLTLPPQTIDVNIHPRKEELVFLQKEQVMSTITKTIQQTLNKASLVYEQPSWFSDSATSRYDDDTNSALGISLKHVVRATPHLSPSATEDILHIHNLYLLQQTEEGLVIIDQHAAHERILYETLKEELNKKKKPTRSHVLSKPVLFDVSLSDNEILFSLLPLLTTQGFLIEPFHNTTYQITQVPFFLKGRNVKKVLDELIDSMGTAGKLPAIDSTTERLLKYLACRGSIKRGDSLTLPQQKQLLSHLRDHPDYVTCPHGRPIRVHLPLSVLNKSFKR